MISVIIPTCNRNELLGKCLDALKPGVQTIGSNDYEVIVTDDSKESIAAEFIQTNYAWVKWVKGPAKGPAANRNNGAKYAKGEWLVFIDDDCIPDDNIIKTYHSAITNEPDMLAFEGRIYVNAPQTSFLQEAPLNYTGGFFWSCNICIQKGLFLLLHGFDEMFPFAAMEDVDLFKRLKQNTNKHRFVFDAAVMHPWRMNKHLFKTTLKRYKANEYYLLKHPEEKQRINSHYYFQAFARQLSFTLKNAWKFRFSGFVQKFNCDLLQLYFGISAVFRHKPAETNNRTTK